MTLFQVRQEGRQGDKIPGALAVKGPELLRERKKLN